MLAWKRRIGDWTSQPRRFIMPLIRLLKRPLDIEEILGWVAVYREATGEWPTKISGGIAPSKFETWAAVDAALRRGLRGLPGGGSLAQLLTEKLGARNVQSLPCLTVEGILQWADEHHAKNAKWPTHESGPIPKSGGENWRNIDAALRKGLRGLPGASSVARLLAKHRGVRNRKALPPFTEVGILVWIDAHHQREGTWPKPRSGAVIEAPGETWLAVEMALRHGQRGLPGGSSLALLLAEKCGVRNNASLPALSIKQILSWADAVHDSTGSWPNINSGPIPDAPGETWNGINHALLRGSRGLYGCCSLAELLALKRGVRNQTSVPKLTRRLILVWADAHHRRTGQWPMQDSGTIQEAPEETWAAIDEALRSGLRGLRGGSSLPRLLAQHRKRRHIHEQPPLSQKKILRWADAHHLQSGEWPNVNSGEVLDAPGEKWDLIDNALRVGHRGLRGGSSLLKLLARKRGVRNPLCLPPLTEEQIVQWAQRHVERTGTKPSYYSGPIADAPGETWAGVDSDLRYGKRTLLGGSSLAKLLDKSLKT
jgi:hypothetical protein